MHFNSDSLYLYGAFQEINSEFELCNPSFFSARMSAAELLMSTHGDVVPSGHGAHTAHLSLPHHITTDHIFLKKIQLKI